MSRADSDIATRRHASPAFAVYRTLSRADSDIATRRHASPAFAVYRRHSVARGYAAMSSRAAIRPSAGTKPD